jgi:hypothetical protein
MSLRRVRVPHQWLEDGIERENRLAWLIGDALMCRIHPAMPCRGQVL